MDKKMESSKSEIAKTALPKARKESVIPVLKTIKTGTTTPKLQSTTNIPAKVSKVQSRDTTSISARSPILTPPAEKRFLLRKKSKTAIDLKSAASSLSRVSNSPISTRKFPSTSTVNSTSHKPGEIPSYLKKPKKGAIEAELNAKKRVFNVQKKKLNDLQSDFLMTHKNLQEMLKKQNAPADNIDSIGDVKLVAIVENDAGKLLIRDDLEKLFEAKEKKISPRKIPSSSLDINKIRSKLTTINETGFKLCHEVLENLNKIQFENEVGDGNTIQDQIMSIIKIMNEKVVDKENEQVKHFTEAISEIQKAILNKTACGGDTHQLFENNKKTEQNASLMKELQEYKNKLEASESKLKLLSEQETKTIEALKSQLYSQESLLADKDMEILRTRESLRQIEESLQKESNKLSTMSQELQAKENIIEKLEKDCKDLRERCSSYESNSAEIDRQKKAILDVIRKENETNKLYQVEYENRKKLEATLVEKDNTIANLKDLVKQNGTCEDRSTYETRLYNEVQTLKVAIDRLMKEKQMIEMEKEELSKILQKSNCNDLKSELAKMKDEIIHLNKTNHTLRDNVARLESIIAQKVAIISELEKKVANGLYLANASKELQKEISNLCESESKKKREIDLLRSELAKARIEIKQQEETISINQRLLRIRSELIDTLQEKEKTARFRIDELNAEITKKRTLINQVWADYKYKVKTKLKFNKDSKRKTGGGPFHEKCLDIFEESVVKSAGLEAAVEGIPSTKSYGCFIGNAETYPVAVEQVEMTEEFFNGNLSEMNGHEIEAESSDTQTVPKKTAKANKLDYMQQYIEKLTEANKIQAEILEQKKKETAFREELLELKKKKYYLQKEKIKDKRMHRIESLKLRKMLIEAKIESNRLKALQLSKT